MKVLILLSTILLLGACATTPTMKSIVGTDVEKEGYKGRVKSVKVSSFTIMEKEGKQVRTPVRSYTPSTSSYTPSIKYDEKGNQTETVSYDASGKVTDKSTFKYDEKGNQTETVSYDASGKIRYKRTYKHDEKGNKVEEGHYSGSRIKITTKSTFKYDKDGNIIELVRFNPAGELLARRTFKYDETGRNIEEVKYYGDGTINQKTTSKIDEEKRGWITEWVRYDLQGKIVSRRRGLSLIPRKRKLITNSKYDEKGREVERLTYNSRKEIMRKYAFRYDEKGYQIESVHYRTDGKISSKATVKYDEKGNKTKRTTSVPKTANGETRFVPTFERTWEFTYWD